MKTSLVWLAVCAVVMVVGLGSGSPVGAAGYSLETVPVYQLDVLNSQDPDEFRYPVDWLLTTSVDEAAALVGHGWTNRGIAFWVSPVGRPGTVALYRLYSPGATDHFYTTSWEERQGALGMGYAPDGVLGYVVAKDVTVSGMAELHRFYVGGREQFHVYSVDPAASRGGSYDGVECHVWTSKTVVASMTVTAPGRGEEVKGASEYEITWNSSARGGYVSLSYSVDAGTTWVPIEYGVENKGYRTWRVPNVATTHGRVRIVWTDNLFGETNVLAIAESEYDFKIAQVRLAIPRRMVTAVAVKLGAPGGLTAKAESASEVKLTWKAVEGEPEGYIVERQMGDGPFLQIANVRAPGVAYTDTGACPGTRYAYRVRAYGPGINSALFAQAAANTALSLQAAGARSEAQGVRRQRVRQRVAE